MKTKSIEARIAAAIVELTAPLTKEEIEMGWSINSKAALGQYLVRLLSKGLSNQDVTSISISRSADHWGVVDGRLLEELASISNELRRLGAKVEVEKWKRGLVDS